MDHHISVALAYSACSGIVLGGDADLNPGGPAVRIA